MFAGVFASSEQAAQQSDEAANSIQVDIDFFIFRYLLVTTAKVGRKQEAVFTQKSASRSFFGYN